MDDDMKCEAMLGIANYISLMEYDELLSNYGVGFAKAKEEFKSISYGKWAAMEIARRIQENKSEKVPLNIILDFIGEMEKCIYSAKSEKMSAMFSTVRDEAIDIYDYMYFDWYRRLDVNYTRRY